MNQELLNEVERTKSLVSKYDVMHNKIKELEAENMELRSDNLTANMEFPKEIEQLRSDLANARDSFKNFHRNLCKRFNFGHDEIDWMRDQASLEEHIAGLLAKKDAEIERYLSVAKGCHDYNGGHHGERENEIFHHGIQTVINSLESLKRNGLNNTQVLALHEIGKRL